MYKRQEYREAKLVAEHCNTNHQEIELSFKKLTDSLPTILWHMEFPFGRPSILSNFLVAEEVKKHVTVAYTGEGSDELFGGYPSFKIVSQLQEKKKLLKFFPDILTKFGANLLKNVMPSDQSDKLDSKIEIE